MTGIVNAPNIKQIIVDKVFEVIAYLLPTQTVDKAIGVINKAVVALQKAEAAQLDAAAKLKAEAAALAAKAATASSAADVLLEDAARAGRVRENLTAITA